MTHHLYYNHLLIHSSSIPFIALINNIRLSYLSSPSSVSSPSIFNHPYPFSIVVIVHPSSIITIIRIHFSLFGSRRPVEVAFFRTTNRPRGVACFGFTSYRNGAFEAKAHEDAWQQQTVAEDGTRQGLEEEKQCKDIETAWSWSVHRVP